MKTFLSALAVAGVTAASAGQAMACDKMEKVTSAWLPIMQTTAYYVALEEKLFEKACIEIISNKMQSPNHIIDALVGGRADFGPPGAAAGIAMLAEEKFPGTFKVFGLQGGGIKIDRINDGLIVKPDSGIESFADLKGKTLGHVPGIQWRTISKKMVKAAGLDPDKDVTLTDLAVAMQVPAVAGGSVDATLSLEPVGSIAVASGKAKRAMTNPVASVIADPFYSGAAVLTTKFMKERPEVAAKVVEVIDEAIDLVNADFEKYKVIIPKYTAIQESQLDLLAQPYLRPFYDLNETDLNSYQAFVDIFYEFGVMKEKMNVREKMLKKEDLAG
ncbi:nitrate ABC transporter substrate-binding protein [Rhodobium orientis]|uniref:Nitrate ABC transporter substrate-binding protein n=2 Tax=Rhodobium orientis TaxID=34017 RepID=A0A327JWA3_9HYPH|nr:nitrate ABC transporter substrate-binding protein [Rhodobium orientis]RAI29865.1 nitrate ABC transporter substrate-binding protein [Rhodobium orientis]